jgi:(p)ppGpp synthase/HD superfamily hydrolase
MFSTDVAQAFDLALELHRDQCRKGTHSPYIGHLMGVAALVTEHGGSQAQVIAAFLHDALEDQGDKISAAEIEAKFGGEVAAMVVSCTDATLMPWRTRKEAHLAHLPEAPPSAWLVSCADKLDNAEALLADLHEYGDAVLDRFTAGKEEVLWYYRELANSFLRLIPGPLERRLDRAVSEIERLTDAAGAR